MSFKLQFPKNDVDIFAQIQLENKENRCKEHLNTV